MGSNPVQAWIFFRPSIHYRLSSVHNCEDPFHIHVFIRSSNIYDFHTFTAVYSPLHGFIRNEHDDQHPVGFFSSVGRVVHRYRRGHRFKSRTGLNFFSGLLFTTAWVFSANIFFQHHLPANNFFLFLSQYSIALLNYFTKNLINSTIATYFVDIRSTHL